MEKNASEKNPAMAGIKGVKTIYSNKTLLMVSMEGTYPRALLFTTISISNHTGIFKKH